MTTGHWLYPFALTSEQVQPGVKFISLNRSGDVLRRGTFTSGPRSMTIEGLTILYAETSPDPNYGVSHVYFGDAGIAEHPVLGDWHPQRFTIAVNPYFADSLTGVDVRNGCNFVIVNSFMGETHSGRFTEKPAERHGRIVAHAITRPSYPMRDCGINLAAIGIVPYPDGRWNKTTHTAAREPKDLPTARELLGNLRREEAGLSDEWYR